MGDDEYRHIISLGEFDEEVGACPYLGDAACDGIDLGRIHSLYGVDDKKARLHLITHREDILEVGLGIYHEVVADSTAYPVGSQLDLLFRLFAADIEDGAVGACDAVG